MGRTVEGNQPVSYTLLCAVAEVEGCHPTDLPPLHDALDVDALDALFSTEMDEIPQFKGSLTFEYSDSFVTIWSGRSITVSVSRNMSIPPEEGVEDDPPSATEDVARLRLRARHLSLSELEAAEVVEWDRDEHIVRKGRRFYDKWDKIR